LERPKPSQLKEKIPNIFSNFVMEEEDYDDTLRAYEQDYKDAEAKYNPCADSNELKVYVESKLNAYEMLLDFPPTADGMLEMYRMYHCIENNPMKTYARLTAFGTQLDDFVNRLKQMLPDGDVGGLESRVREFMTQAFISYHAMVDMAAFHHSKNPLEQGAQVPLRTDSFITPEAKSHKTSDLVLLVNHMKQEFFLRNLRHDGKLVMFPKYLEKTDHGGRYGH
jgi:hypothetical protein